MKIVGALACGVVLGLAGGYAWLVWCLRGVMK